MCPSLRGRTDRAAIGDRSSSRKISASVERSSRSLRAIEDREEVLRGSIRDRSRSHVDPYAMSKPTWRDSTRAPLAHDQRSECDRVLTMIVMTIDDESPRIRSRSMPRFAISRSRTKRASDASIASSSLAQRHRWGGDRSDRIDRRGPSHPPLIIRDRGRDPGSRSPPRRWVLTPLPPSPPGTGSEPEPTPEKK